MATILVVDDRPTNREFLTTLLGYHGHRLLEAADGVAALAAARAERPDLVITDVLMPVMDGYELVRRMRADPDLAAVPVVFCTAHYRPDEVQNLARSCGVSHILTKACEPDVVLRVVEAALGATPSAAPTPLADFRREHVQVLTDKLAEKANELRATSDRLALLIAINLELASERGPRRLLDKVCQAARGLLGAQYAALWVVGDDGRTPRHFLASGLDAETAARLGAPSPPRIAPDALLAQKRTLRLRNAGGDPTAVGLPALHPPVYSWLGAVVASPSKQYGWLCLADKVGAEEFSEEDERLAEVLAGQVGRVYENGSLYDEVLRHAEELEREAAERKRAEHRQSILLAVSQALAESATLREACQKVLQAICKGLDWELGSIWRVDRTAGVLRCVEVMQGPAGKYPEWEEQTRRITFAPGVGLPGRVWLDRQPAWIPDVVQDANFPRAALALKAGLHAGFAFPILSGEHILGVVEFFSPRFRASDQDLLQVFTGISGPLGQFMERKQTVERLRHVVSSSPAILVSLRVETEIAGLAWVSDNVKALMGYEPKECLRPGWWWDNLHPDDGDGIRARWPALLADGRHSMEFRFRHKDGVYRWVRDELHLIRDESGKPVEVVGSWSDVTERKSLEEQFRQAQKMEAIGRLAGGVAHDFNNLLTVIGGYSDMLLNDMGPNDPSYGFIREIRRAGERASALTRQLLAFSRKQILAPVPLDLNAVVAEAEKMLRRLIGEDVDLAAVLDRDLGHVMADPGQIEQVLLNLAVNARDAMPGGGRLTIETHNVELDAAYAETRSEVRPGPYVLLAVSDTGCGMTPEVQARIFEPFYTTKEVGKGTGLGLATVYGVAKQSNGHIAVYSELGRGTTFKLYLPRITDAALTRKADKDLFKIPEGNETILLAEDEDGVRTLARLVLESCGYAVLEARDGADALRLAKAEPGPVHLLATDVVMPRMSGRQLADALRAGRPALKVLFLSGYTEDVVIRHDVLEADMAFLEKPFTPAALARKVRQVLDRVGQAHD